MKKFLAILTLVAVIGCSVPVSAHEVHRGNYHYSYNQPPRHEVEVHHYRHDNYGHRPVQKNYYYSNTSRTGAVLGGFLAGAALLAGVVAAIAY